MAARASGVSRSSRLNYGQTSDQLPHQRVPAGEPYRPCGGRGHPGSSNGKACRVSAIDPYRSREDGNEQESVDVQMADAIEPLMTAIES